MLLLLLADRCPLQCVCISHCALSQDRETTNEVENTFWIAASPIIFFFFFRRSDVDSSSYHTVLVLNDSRNDRLDRADAGGDGSDRRATPRDPLSDSEGLRAASTTGRRRCNKRTNYKFVSSPQFDVVMIIITIVVVRNSESDRSTSVVVVVVATKRCDPIQATVYDKNWWRDKGALRRVVSIERKACHKKNRVWIHIIQ